MDLMRELEAKVGEVDFHLDMVWGLGEEIASRIYESDERDSPVADLILEAASEALYRTLSGAAALQDQFDADRSLIETALAITDPARAYDR